jgi:hypothetical protein
MENSLSQRIILAWRKDDGLFIFVAIDINLPILEMGITTDELFVSRYFTVNMAYWAADRATYAS